MNLRDQSGLSKFKQFELTSLKIISGGTDPIIDPIHGPRPTIPR
jgi:hypothetical protein